MIATTSNNRIMFPGNPWPKGHAIKEFVWSARLETTSGVWFHLHLESADYYAEDPPNAADDTPANASDWRSKLVWNNFHACTLSSTNWGDSGFLVGSRESPLDLATLSGQSFKVDPLPFDLDKEPSIGIYLLGHDTVAGHRITFTKGASNADWAIDWQGNIALTYAGQDTFDYQFVVRKTGVRFDGIYLPEDIKEDQAATALTPFVRDIHSYSLDKTPDGELRFLYTGTK